MDTLNKIIELIEEGKTFREIEPIVDLRYDTIRRILDKLKDSNSIYYDLEKYEKLNKLIFENRKQAMMGNKFGRGIAHYKNDYILKILDGTMSIEQVAKALKYSHNGILEMLKNYYDKNPSDKLKEIITQYNSNFSEFESMELSKKNTNFQYEIVMVALTYRVSVESLAKLLKTSRTDIDNLFNNFENLGLCYERLKFETNNEPEKLTELAIKNATYYFKRRNEILKLLSKARKDNDLGKIKVLEEKLKTLRSEIDDTNIEKIKEKIDLTDEDKENIVKYRIKYYLSRGVCANMFNIEIIALRWFEDKLIKNDLFYRTKLTFLNDIMDLYYNSNKTVSR